MQDLNIDALTLVAARFRVLAEPLRLAILKALHERERTVSELADAVGTSQPNVSKHLRLLEGAGMVARRQEGTTVHCRIADTTVLRLCDLVCQGVWGQLQSRAAALGAPLTRSLPRRRRSAPLTSTSTRRVRR
jgi:DNA-binding transcriptional ArsR family regulator